MSAQPRRLGLFGGTFDPVHFAHLAIAEWARVDLRLEQVLFVPNQSPPHKAEVLVTSAQHRLAMLQLAIADNPHFSVCTVELEREGASYTVDTLRWLRQTPDFADATLFWILGTDSLEEFDQWHQPEAIQGLCVLAAYPRLGARPERGRRDLVERAILLKAPLIELASSDIRRRFGAGHSIRYLVPDAVRDYIERSGLYRR